MNWDHSLSRRQYMQTLGASVALGLSSTETGATADADKMWGHEIHASTNSPTVVDGTVFVGAMRRGVYALDADTGTEQWRFETDDMFATAPTVVDGVVYAGDTGGKLHAIDATDGAVFWTNELDTESSRGSTVVDGTVYVGFGSTTSDSGGVYAVDAGTGEREWTSEIRASSSPTVFDGTIFVGSYDNSVYALNVDDGSEQWSFETGTTVSSSPTLADDAVFFGSNSVYALDTNDGRERWSFDPEFLARSSPTVMNGTVFVGSNDSNVYALDADDGTELWSYETGSSVNSSPTVADGAVYIGSDDQSVYALDARDGSVIWTHETAGRVTASPTVFNGVLFVGREVTADEENPDSIIALQTEIGGSSECSRTDLGTLGHHEEWRYAEQQIDIEPAFFEIEFDQPQEQVVSGEEIEIVFTVSNTGTISDTQSIDFSAGEKSETMELSLTGGESTTETLSLSTDEDDVGELTVTGASEDDDATTTVAVDEPADPAEFEVTVAETSEPVAGKRLDVTVEVENTGDVETTQTIEVTGGNHSETTQISLTGGESTTETLSLSTDENESGELTVTVASEDDEATTTVEVTEPEGGGGTNGGGFGTTETLAVGGGGGLVTLLGMYALLRSSDEEKKKDRTPAASGPSSRDESPPSEPPTESSDQSLVDTFDEQIDDIQTHLSTARDAQQTSDYDSALQACQTAIEIVQDANANTHTSERGDEIEDLLTEATQLQQTLDSEQERYETTTTTLDRIAEALDTVTNSLETGHSGDAQETLQEIEGTLTDAAQQLADSSFPELEQRLDRLETRYNSLQDQIQDTRTDSPIPETIPATRRRSLAYDDMQKGNPLGSGGNADVYHATARTDDGEIELAIKEPRMSGTVHTETVERMLEEAETWQQLDDHDHIVSVVDYGAKPLPWIAMEYMDAGHIGDRAEDMSVDQKLWTAIATTQAVRHAHRRGVAHLDLKPENILLRSVENAWDVPKVADWGLSKHLLKHSKSVEGMSPHYAAPEQFDEEFGPADDITDVYQLGAVFYELFTGRPPFEGRPTKVMRAVIDEEPTPPTEIAEVPPKLDEILLTALAKEKDDRYETVIYLRDELQHLR